MSHRRPEWKTFGRTTIDVSQLTSFASYDRGMSLVVVAGGIEHYFNDHETAEFRAWFTEWSKPAVYLTLTPGNEAGFAEDLAALAPAIASTLRAIEPSWRDKPPQL